MSNKQYLGDSVYIEEDFGQLKLTTENGISTIDTIYLELEVMNGLIEYYKKLLGVDTI